MTARWALALLASISLAACDGTVAPAASSSAAQPVTVRIAANNISPSTAYLYLAQDVGIFAKHGVSVDLQPMAGAAGNKAVVAGQVDGQQHGAPAETINVRSTGTDVVVVATFSSHYDDVVVATDGIDSLAQLRGKTVAASTVASTDALAAVTALRKLGGLEPDTDYKLVGAGGASQAGTAGMIAAHQVDAAVIQHVFALQVTNVPNSGLHVLSDLANTDLRIAGEPIVLRGEFIHAHPDAVQKFIDSLIEAVHYFKERPADTKAFLTRFYKIDDAAVDEVYQREAEHWDKTPLPINDAFNDAVEFMAPTNPKARDVDLSQMIDTRFVEDAQRRGLTNY